MAEKLKLTDIPDDKPVKLTEDGAQMDCSRVGRHVALSSRHLEISTDASRRSKGVATMAGSGGTERRRRFTRSGIEPGEAWDLINGRLVRPFSLSLRLSNTYWIVCPQATSMLPKIKACRDWLLAEAADDLRRLNGVSSIEVVSTKPRGRPVGG